MSAIASKKNWVKYCIAHTISKTRTIYIFSIWKYSFKASGALNNESKIFSPLLCVYEYIFFDIIIWSNNYKYFGSLSIFSGEQIPTLPEFAMSINYIFYSEPIKPSKPIKPLRTDQTHDINWHTILINEDIDVELLSIPK